MFGDAEALEVAAAAAVEEVGGGCWIWCTSGDAAAPGVAAAAGCVRRGRRWLLNLWYWRCRGTELLLLQWTRRQCLLELRH